MSRLRNSVHAGLQLAARAGGAALLALDDRVLSHRRSRTGYANPRVRHFIDRLGFAIHSYRTTVPNLRAWLGGKRELFPLLVQVQTVNRCNAACEFCPYPYTIALQPKQTMSDEIYTKIITECASEPGMRSFCPMGKNEPLMDPRLEERIAAFRKIARPHQIIELVTNGSMLSPRRVQGLVDAGLDLLTVSVSATNPDTYAKVMKGLSWERVTANLDALAARDLPTMNVYIRFVQNMTNRRDLKQFRRRWGRFNLFGFNINDRAGTVRGFDKLRIEYSAPLRRLRRTLGSSIWPICPYVTSMAHVLENGDVPFCLNDWQGREVLGNIKDATLREIYNSPRMQEIRSLQAQGRFAEIAACKDCSFYHDWWKPPLER